jgi:GTP-binding protein Era
MSKEKKNPDDKFRAGYVAIIGEPNVGKSTLMNSLLEQKISIVTAKPQTTRRRTLGILNGEGYQAIFLDTPGILKPKYLLQKAMVETAYSAIDDADIVFLMIEAGFPEIEHDEKRELVLSSVKRAEKPSFLLINKIDLVPKAGLLPIIDRYSKLSLFKEIIPISALNHENLDDLKETLIRYLPVGEPYFPQDAITDQPERFFVAELIREKVFEKYRDEIPYSTEVEVVEFKEREGMKDFISAEISVERDSQKGILIGKGGTALKQVGELARKEIEEFLGRSVFLEVRVKVRRDWRRDERWLKRLGYGER